MPKIRLDELDDYLPMTEKSPKRKNHNLEEFSRDSRKRNKRNKKHSYRDM